MCTLRKYLPRHQKPRKYLINQCAFPFALFAIKLFKHSYFLLLVLAPDEAIFLNMRLPAMKVNPPM